MSEIINVIISEQDEKLRIDKYLTHLSQISSRNQALQLIKLGHVTVNNKSIKPSYLLQENDSVEITLPESKVVDSIQPYELQLDILHEDASIIVINKPSGLVMHPAAGHEADTLVNALVHHTDDLSMGTGEKRPGIVHRLDKDTSGLIVVAKNNFAHENLAKQFKDRSIHRMYHAIIFGSYKEEHIKTQSYLKRHPTNRKKFASEILSPKIKPTGKLAITNIYQQEVLNSGLSKIKCKLETGRTHQIRIHTSESGHPIVGDDLYGGLSRAKSLKSTALRATIKNMNRIALHAAELGFIHPATGEKMFFSSPWPEELEFLTC